MLKTYRVLCTPDVNTDSASSTGQTEDVNTAASSTAETQKDVKEELLTNEQIRDQVIKQVTSKPDASETAKEVTETEKVEEKTEVSETSIEVKDEDLPFGKHPRWIERQKELETLRPLKDKVAEMEPVFQHAKQVEQYRQQNQIDDQLFGEALQLAALFKQNPAQARAHLAQVIQNIDLQSGAALPKDLQDEVTAGAISAERAKEISLYRVQMQQSGQTNQQLQAQQNQSFEQAVNGVFGMWDNAKRASDPDFKPKVDAAKPDGKWELVNQRLLVLKQAMPPRNQQEAVALVERAYNETNAVLAQFVPKLVSRKSLSSQQSSQNTQVPKFKTAREAALAIGRGENVSPSQVNGYQ